MLESSKGFLGITTNNVAEYTAILEAARAAMRFNPEKIVFKTDSELIARQFSGIYKIRDERLKKIHNDIKKVIGKIPFSVEHIPREQNRLADKLSKEAVKSGGALVVSDTVDQR